MKKLLSSAVVATVFLGLGSISLADGIAEAWTCTLKDGNTMEDVQAVNSKWLGWINTHVEGGGITSSIGTPVIGKLETFIFVDSYPSLAAWAEARDASESDEGNELDGMFEDVSECKENRLWSFEDTE